MASAAITKATAGLTLEQRYGQFEVWTSNSRAVVVNTSLNKVVKRLTGESAWSNAVRVADDLYTDFRRQ